MTHTGPAEAGHGLIETSVTVDGDQIKHTIYRLCKHSGEGERSPCLSHFPWRHYIYFSTELPGQAAVWKMGDSKNPFRELVITGDGERRKT